MKKFVKIGIATLALGATVGFGISVAQANVFAQETTTEEKQLKIDADKNVAGYDVYKGYYEDNNNRPYDIYYTDGYFTQNPAEYQPHMATLAAELAHASNTHKENDDYTNGALKIKEALGTIGFENIIETDTYKIKPTKDTIACVFGQKPLANKGDMKYKYVIDITVRSASYEAEWANNVKLGLTGEAEGFGGAANKIVETYLPEYLNKYPELDTYLNNGQVAFFINGYSRGAATANLTAKKLIDEYQDEGNGIYAYCIEAPQGGVGEAELENKDYTGIHNIINPNDLVCYVGPTLMGFKRYGVDHYVCGKEITDYRYNTGLNQQTPCDNEYDTRGYQTKKKEVIEELKIMLNNGDISEYTPYDVTYKQLDLRHFKIKDIKNNNMTKDFIQNFVTKLMYNRGKLVMDRTRYANKLEPAVANVMTFLFNDPDFAITKVTNIGTLLDVFTDALDELTCHVKAVGKPGDNALEIAWKFITGSDDLIYKLDFTEDVRKAFAGIAKKVVGSQEVFVRLLNDKYPTKAEGALKDIYTIVYEATCGENNIDDLITFGYNIQGIFKNHSMLQTIAWLRLEDDFFTYTGTDGGW